MLSSLFLSLLASANLGCSLSFLSAQVNFLTKLVALKPGKTVQEMIRNVMLGMDEGADNSGSEEDKTAAKRVSGGIAGRVSELKAQRNIFL